MEKRRYWVIQNINTWQGIGFIFRLFKAFWVEKKDYLTSTIITISTVFYSLYAHAKIIGNLPLLMLIWRNLCSHLILKSFFISRNFLLLWQYFWMLLTQCSPRTEYWRSAVITACTGRRGRRRGHVNFYCVLWRRWRFFFRWFQITERGSDLESTRVVKWPGRFHQSSHTRWSVHCCESDRSVVIHRTATQTHLHSCGGKDISFKRQGNKRMSYGKCFMFL